MTGRSYLGPGAVVEQVEVPSLPTGEIGLGGKRRGGALRAVGSFVARPMPQGLVAMLAGAKQPHEMLLGKAGGSGSGARGAGRARGLRVKIWGTGHYK